MSTTENHKKVLEKALNDARKLLADSDVNDALKSFEQKHSFESHLKEMKHGAEVPSDLSISDGAKTIVANLSKSKYLYSILLTGLVEKEVNPSQDIRITQKALTNGYSNRSRDQIIVTPFLKRHSLTHCAASGAESGRNFERPESHSLSYSGKPNGKRNREAYLGLVHAVQIEGVEPLPLITFLFALDLLHKQKTVYEYPRIKSLTVQQIIDMVLKHHQSAVGAGRARLPMLAIQAVYQSLTIEMGRYKNTKLRNPPNRHTGNDKKGWIGDVQVEREDGSPFEAVEVKSGHKITADMVRALSNKFRGAVVDRYYILSSEEVYISPGEEKDVKDQITEVQNQTGCEVIANGLNRSLWYYLRLLSEPSVFVENYTVQIEQDKDVKPEHREIWSRILSEVASNQSQQNEV